MALITLDHITKVYPRSTRPALDDVTLSIERGEFVFLVGASGSGKTTLLSLLIAEEDATDGEIRVAGNDLRRIPNRQIPRYRRSIGFVFQDYKLLENKTVWQNVAFALEVLGHSRSTIKSLVPQALKTVGLTGKEDRYPQELSGGEAQRVAIARAYVNHPQIILADEPTGNLDPTTSVGIMEVLEAVNRTGTTIVMATHNEEIVNSMRKRVIELHEGVVVRDEKSGSYDSSVYYPDADVESAALNANGRAAIRMAGEADADEANVVPQVAAPADGENEGGIADLAAAVNGASPNGASPNSASVGRGGDADPMRRFRRGAQGADGARDVSADASITPGFVAGSLSPDGQSEGIARLVRNVHSGRTGRYGEAFASVEETLTWGKGLRLDEHDAAASRADASPKNGASKVSESKSDASVIGASVIGEPVTGASVIGASAIDASVTGASQKDDVDDAAKDAQDSALEPPMPPEPPTRSDHQAALTPPAPPTSARAAHAGNGTDLDDRTVVTDENDKNKGGRR